MTFDLHLDSETVSHLRTAPAFCVSVNTAVKDVVARMQAERRASALVCREEWIVGIFTERDVVRLMAQSADLSAPIESVMTKQPQTVTADASIAKAIELMSRGGYRRLPVVDDQGRPTALVKVSHILHYLVAHFSKVIYNLPPQPHVQSHEREGA